MNAKNILFKKRSSGKNIENEFGKDNFNAFNNDLSILKKPKSKITGINGTSIAACIRLETKQRKIASLFILYSYFNKTFYLQEKKIDAIFIL